MYRGELLSYLVSTAYSIAGALLGVPPGQEFRAAIQAAERVPSSPHSALATACCQQSRSQPAFKAVAASVHPCMQLAVVMLHTELLSVCRNLNQAGAEIVLADRDQDITLRRLGRATRLMKQRPEGLPVAGELHRLLHAALHAALASRKPS